MYKYFSLEIKAEEKHSQGASEAHTLEYFLCNNCQSKKIFNLYNRKDCACTLGFSDLPRSLCFM
jgi:hypothetical protein